MGRLIVGKNRVKGVRWRSDRCVWVAGIMVSDTHICLGYYKNKSDAIKARREAEEKYFGNFRRLPAFLPYNI